jgi:hypothetical protein
MWLLRVFVYLKKSLNRRRICEFNFLIQLNLNECIFILIISIISKHLEISTIKNALI